MPKSKGKLRGHPKVTRINRALKMGGLPFLAPKQIDKKIICLLRSRFSQGNLNKVAAKLNYRPRRTLGLRTPTEKLNEVLR